MAEKYRRILVVALSAVGLAALLHFRYGYAAGQRDHLVLSPVGMQWAHPDWFANDWTIASAPQPHWLFDVLTWLGTATGTLAGIYLVYWLGTLTVFAATTVMLARAWAPRFVVVATLVVTVCSALTPLYVLGSGSLLFATALPNMLGGAALFATAAALLLNRSRLAAGAGVGCALVHLQHGAISAALLLVMAAVMFVRTRQVDRFLLGGGAMALIIVAINASLRPVVGHPDDFAEACRLLIPYHCEASTWPVWDVRGGVALVGLALLTLVYLAPGQRFRWWFVVALPAVALLGGLAIDLLNVPRLATLVQGVNVYRLSLLMLPLAVWGALAPVFAQLAPQRRWITLAAVILLLYPVLRMLAGQLRSDPRASWLAWLALAAALVLATAGRVRVRDPAMLVRGALAALIAIALAMAVGARALQARPFDPRLYPTGALAGWSARAQAEIPSGQLVLIPPQNNSLRMLLKRAVVVDCKYGPYGGAPWQEYKARVLALGGFRQCRGGAGPAYGGLSTAEVAAAAKRYRADFVVIDRNQPERVRQLESAGWTTVVLPAGGAGYFVLKAPWTTR